MSDTSTNEQREREQEYLKEKRALIQALETLDEARKFLAQSEQAISTSAHKVIELSGKQGPFVWVIGGTKRLVTLRKKGEFALDGVMHPNYTAKIEELSEED